MKNALVRRSTVTLAAATVLTPLVLVAASGTAAADELSGCTPTEHNTTLVCGLVDAADPHNIRSIGGNFKSIDPVVRPRLHVRLLDEKDQVVDEVEQNWGNDRLGETVRKPINRSFPQPLGRVCATLYQAGELMNTGCVRVPSAP